MVEFLDLFSVDTTGEFSYLSLLYVHLVAFVWGFYTSVRIERIATINVWETVVVHTVFFIPVYAFCLLVDLVLFSVVVVQVVCLVMASFYSSRGYRYGTFHRGGYLRALYTDRMEGHLVRNEDELDELDVLVITRDDFDKASSTKGLRHDLIREAMKRGINLRLDFEVLQETYGYVEVSKTIGAGRLDLRQARLFDVLKSIIDRLIAFVVLIVLLPLMALIAATIFFLDGGPVIFRQTRLGEGGNSFTILKFRTMHQNGDGHDISLLGAFLRFSHLDELPQLVNILRGDMAFIGPRPEWQFLSTEENAPPNYWMRRIIKPGLTGWAQVNYKPSRNRHMRQRKLGYDLYYINNRSFFLDALIVLRTLRKFPQMIYMALRP